jgi:hypothetical protein
MRENCPIDVEPFDQSNILQTSNLINLNYTNQNFWSMKSRLRQFIKERFGPEGSELPNSFNDFVESSLAIMEMEIFAFLADTLSFKIDQNAGEVYIGSVTELENAFRIAKNVGFEPQPPIAASSMWSGTISAEATTDVVIGSPIVVNIVSEDDQSASIELFPANSDNEPIFDEDIIIPAGSLVNQSIIGLEGKTHIENFAGNGEISQRYELGFNPVIYDSIRVSVDGVNWEQVDYFTDSQPRKEYRVEFDSEWRAFIIFGNNRAGVIPSQNSQIQATYRVGGGTAGNIVTGYVTTQVLADVSGVSYKVPITLTNYTPGRYGYAGDTIEDIRRKLPLWFKTQDRAVSGEDYKILTDQFSTAYHGQIGKSTAVLRNHGCAGNIVDLYILAKSGDYGLETASTELKSSLIEELNDKKMITDFVCVKDGVVIEADVAIEITLDKFYRKFQDQIKANINRLVNLFFDLNRWDYGDTLRNIDLIKELSSIKQIDTTTITFTTNDADNSGETVTSKFYEVIRPDTVTLAFVYT